VREGDEDILAERLLDWEEQWRQGRDLPAAELCQRHPHLIEELARRIQVLKTTSWLDKPPRPRPEGRSSPPTESAEPRLLAGRYRLDTLFAEGGFSQVWKAFDLELQRSVAVKFPKPGRHNATEAFMAEARRVARLKHPGIVPVYDVRREDDACYIVSEFVEGGNLGQQIRGEPDPLKALGWVAEVAEALEYAHHAGIIHRDIKPANILIDHHGRALLADFGIARSPTSSTALAPSVGTLPYIPPEQLEGGEPDTRSDIFSLGVVLHELLAGRLPYSSSDPVRLRQEIVAGAKLAGLPSRLKAIVAKAMHPNPAARYQTAARLAADLQRSRAGGPTRWPLAAALAGLPVMLGIAGFALWPGNNPDKPPQAAKLHESWFKATAALPAEDQARAVADMLRQLNPGFNGVVKPAIENGVVTGLEFLTDHVTDIAPVRALEGLRELVCGGTFTSQANGILPDLSALKGLKLTRLEVQYNSHICDLSPISGMPLEYFRTQRSLVSDLGPLAGMPLKVLVCRFTEVSDLSPLRGMNIRELYCDHTKVADLSPLRGMPLEQLRCHDMPLKSLEALRGMPLVGLECHRTEVADLSPLRGMKSLFALNVLSTGVEDLSPLEESPGLKWLWCDFVPERDAAALRKVKSLERINNRPAAEVLKRQGN
jgi:hypothetical protein